MRLEHWHPQLVKGEAAFWFSTTRQVVLSTRVVSMLTWVNMVDLRFDSLEDENDLEYVLLCVVHIGKVTEISDFLGFPSC